MLEERILVTQSENRVYIEPDLVGPLVRALRVCCVIVVMTESYSGPRR